MDSITALDVTLMRLMLGAFFLIAALTIAALIVAIVKWYVKRILPKRSASHQLQNDLHAPISSESAQQGPHCEMPPSPR